MINKINKLIENIFSRSNYEIIDKDIYSENLFLIFKEKFDIIFLDPPYRDKNYIKVLSAIHKSNILKKNGIIIIHRHKNEKDSLPLNIKIIEEKKYGISKIIFISLIN